MVVVRKVRPRRRERLGKSILMEVGKRRADDNGCEARRGDGDGWRGDG